MMSWLAWLAAVLACYALQRLMIEYMPVRPTKSSPIAACNNSTEQAKCKLHLGKAAVDQPFPGWPLAWLMI